MERPPVRRYPRLACRRTLLMRTLVEPHHEGFATTRTIGLGGLMFVHRESVGYGSLLEVLVALHRTVVKTDAKVVYERPAAGGGVEVGVEFLRLSPLDRSRLESLIETGN